MMDYIFIAIIGFTSSMVTAISGGGGTFAVPAMLAFGVPPINALLLNRIVDVAVAFGSLWNYIRSKTVDWKIALYAVILLPIGGFIGSKTVLAIPEKILSWSLIVATCGAIFLLLTTIRSSERSNIKASPKQKILGGIAIAFGGFWSGAFGMGGATIGTLAISLGFNKKFLAARSTQIIGYVPETLISAAVLFTGATLNFKYIAVMFVSSLVGAYLGSLFAVKTDGKIIRTFMVAISFAMLTKVVFDLL